MPGEEARDGTSAEESGLAAAGTAPSPPPPSPPQVEAPEEPAEEPPFPRVTHLCSPAPDEEALREISALRAMLREKADLFDEDWATDEQLHRCLIAKQFNKEVALNLATDALRWRKKRAPHLIENTEGWQRAFELEAETGKIYSPGMDRWQRPVVVFDNGAANTTDIDAQMLFLGWVLNFACREMPPHVDKYHIFMHLESFSFFSIPPLSATTETISMLCTTFPERLGHCIAYRPPGLFKTFFNSVKPFIDPKTAAKMIFITGDVSDGSANDKLLRELIGDDWKVLTGAEQPILQKTKPPSSPGYLHSERWPALMKRVEAVRQREQEEASRKPARALSQEATKVASPPAAASAEPEPEPPQPLPPLYNEEEDGQRTTYSSHAEFKKAKLDAMLANGGADGYDHYELLEITPQTDGPVVTCALLLIEQFFYFLEDMVTFKKYIAHLVDTFLGPSTAPTKLFVRFTLIVCTIVNRGDHPKMRTFAASYMVAFLAAFFLLHDLRVCKKHIDAFVRQHAL